MQQSIDRRFIGLGAVFGLTGVAAGAFGAHGLRDHLSDDMLAIYKTAVDYQLWHTAALLAVGLLPAASAGGARSTRPLAISGWLFVVGIVIFSGTLYTLSVTGVRWLGAITPLGGTALIVGWATLAWWSIRAAAMHDREQHDTQSAVTRH